MGNRDALMLMVAALCVVGVAFVGGGFVSALPPFSGHDSRTSPQLGPTLSRQYRYRTFVFHQDDRRAGDDGRPLPDTNNNLPQHHSEDGPSKVAPPSRPLTENMSVLSAVSAIAGSSELPDEPPNLPHPGLLSNPLLDPSLSDIADIIANYSLVQLAGQMAQLDVNFLMRADDPYRLNTSAVQRLLQQGKLGSLFNSPSSLNGTWVPDVFWWRNLQQELYELSTTTPVVGGAVDSPTNNNQPANGPTNPAGFPLLFGLDSVHGANYVYNATLFPHQIGMAATFNRSVAQSAGRVTGLETRTAGVPWVFSPILGIAVQPSWARVYETFGEDPYVAREMGRYIIVGLQSYAPDTMALPPNTSLVAACAKHYIGYPNSRTGHDRTPVWLPMNILLQYFAPSFAAAIEHNVLTIMENYVEVNGKPTVANAMLLSYLLRDVHAFDGVLVTDYNEIYNLVDFHRTAATYEAAVGQSLNASSVDMGMISTPYGWPLFADAVVSNVNESKFDVFRVATSAARVAQLKQRLGLTAGSPVPLFGQQAPQQSANTAGKKGGEVPWIYTNHPNCTFGCDGHRQQALEAAQQSVTLLQNTHHFLPWNISTIRRLAIVGQACDSVPLMAGGWSVHWQGTSNKSAFGKYGSTIYEEFSKLAAERKTFSVSFNEGCNITEGSTCDPDHVAAATNSAYNAEFVILCLGESHYAEKPGDIDDLRLPGQQFELAQAIVDANPFVVIVLIEGRPRLLGDIPSQVPSVLHAYLPGPMGGRAVTDVILGNVNPTGRLPVTYPVTPNNAPIQYWRKYSANTGNDYVVQWPFGHGLSYTTFEYTDCSSSR